VPDVLIFGSVAEELFDWPVSYLEFLDAVDCLAHEGVIDYDSEIGVISMRRSQ
jgi:hypothetical protein